ncbi:MAG: type II toxin-antitoxin system VapC family toxin [Opitutales bacterium]|nr:type II toxin-antitoxin system VapC family toxin [Opitutales bacterium]
MIVVDNTVLSDLILGADAVRESAKILVLEDPDWISASLWRFEFGNVLWKIFRSPGDEWENVESPKVVFEAADAALLETVESLDSCEIFSIATHSDLTFYDASYVWLARERGLKLRTRDKKILRKCPDVAVAMPS